MDILDRYRQLKMQEGTWTPEEEQGYNAHLESSGRGRTTKIDWGQERDRIMADSPGQRVNMRDVPQPGRTDATEDRYHYQKPESVSVGNGRGGSIYSAVDMQGMTTRQKLAYLKERNRRLKERRELGPTDGEIIQRSSGDINSEVNPRVYGNPDRQQQNPVYKADIAAYPTQDKMYVEPGKAMRETETEGYYTTNPYLMDPAHGIDYGATGWDDATRADIIEGRKVKSSKGIRSYSDYKMEKSPEKLHGSGSGPYRQKFSSFPGSGQGGGTGTGRMKQDKEYAKRLREGIPADDDNSQILLDLDARTERIKDRLRQLYGD